MPFEPHEHLDADERHEAGQHDAPPLSDTQEPIELDDLPIPEAVFSFDVEYIPADPAVGIWRGYSHVSGDITSWRVGALTLTRDQLIAAMGEDEVCRIEARTCDRVQDQFDNGERRA